ncbi:zinc ribbon domain-containing protein [Defluviitalea phaphyphila]|uniref:zinc ribbon domain-containing protein n=1 Tax=Defluviitalea phaphyphila TaxID=1473580 RepID=UPI00073152A1|nr:zinc ribbon domain-containing protein [Defluviitalea phaphyphila]
MNDWRNKLAKVVKTVKDNTGEIYKTTKINIELGKEQENLKSLYYEIGKKVHEIYQYGGSLGKFFDEKYLEIKEVEEKIEELQNKIEELKKVRICLKCGKEVDRGAKFCPKCGNRMDDEVQKEDNVNINTDMNKVNINSKPEKKICPVCKAENNLEDKFCLSCGRALY